MHRINQANSIVCENLSQQLETITITVFETNHDVNDEFLQKLKKALIISKEESILISVVQITFTFRIISYHLNTTFYGKIEFVPTWFPYILISNALGMMCYFFTASGYLQIYSFLRKTLDLFNTECKTFISICKLLQIFAKFAFRRYWSTNFLQLFTALVYYNPKELSNYIYLLTPGLDHTVYG